MVSLKEFIEIAPDVIVPDICSVMVEHQDEYFGTRMEVELRHFSSVSQLEKYYNYEIFGFDQKVVYGEVDEQYISLRTNKITV